MLVADPQKEQMSRNTIFAEQLAEYFRDNDIKPREMNQVQYAKLNPPFRAPLITRHFGTWRRAMLIVETAMSKLPPKEPVVVAKPKPVAKKVAPKPVVKEENGEV